MNSDTNATPLPLAAQAILSTKPHWLVSLLGLLAAMSASITVILGLFAYSDFLPAQYSVYAGSAALILAALQKAVNHAGDLLDDGIINGSFGRLPSIALFLLCLFLASCNLSKEAWVEIGKAAGQGALQGALPAATAEFTKQQQLSSKRVVPVLP